MREMWTLPLEVYAAWSMEDILQLEGVHEANMTQVCR